MHPARHGFIRRHAPRSGVVFKLSFAKKSRSVADWGGTMTAVAGFRDSRRSTRVPLLVTIEALGIAEPLTCEGETIMVNLHGALISTSVALSAGMKITIHVYLTGNVLLPRLSTSILRSPCAVESH